MNREYPTGVGYCSFAEFYDRLMSELGYQALAEYYDKLITDIEESIVSSQSKTKGILLDLACGTGTLSVLMAKRGWDVIGIDASEEMLSYAKTHTQVSYICQNMTDLDMYGTIDAAICSLDGLNHLPNKAALLKAIGRVSLFMNPGGVFVFDLNTLYKHETILAENTLIKETNDIYCVWRNSYQGEGVIDITLDIFAEHGDGKYERYTEEIRETAYDLSIVNDLCNQCGFEVVGCYDFMTKNQIKPNQNYERAVFVCRKNHV